MARLIAVGERAMPFHGRVLALLALLAATSSNLHAQGGLTADAVLAPVVGVRADIRRDARTGPYLGLERAGSGIVISADGLVATVGYLVLEASAVEILRQDGTAVDAEVVAYDHETGLGLVRAREPLGLPVMPLGDAGRIGVGTRLLATSYDGTKLSVSPAAVVSRRTFAGYWEYLLEEPLFTSPPHPGAFGGAALVDADGALIGIGSLVVRDAREEPPLPGNMFIPVDLLRSARDHMVAHGRGPAPDRPWLGLTLLEQSGALVVRRVAAGGPAQAAGIRPGWLLIGIDGEPVNSLDEVFRPLWAAGTPGVTVTLELLEPIQDADGAVPRSITVTTASRYDWLRLGSE